MLSRNPQTDKSPFKLVDALVGLSSKLSSSSELDDAAERFSTWIDECHKFDEEARFVFEGGDVEVYYPPGAGNDQPGGYYTKVLRYCADEFRAPTTVHGQAASGAPLHVKMLKDVSKGEKDDKNVMWAEVRGFRFTTSNGLTHDQLKERCTTATAGDVIFWPWTHEAGGEMLLPVANLVKKKPTATQWAMHLTHAKRRLRESRPQQVALLAAHDDTAVLDPASLGDVPLEEACQSKYAAFQYIAVQVKKERGVPMSSTELQQYAPTPSATHLSQPPPHACPHACDL